ncbi:hypothetical protein H4R33_007081, partial [Dimargaris cristalligena]
VAQYANTETLQSLSTLYNLVKKIHGDSEVFKIWSDQTGTELDLDMAPLREYYTGAKCALTTMVNLSIHLAIVHLYQTEQYAAISQYLGIDGIPVGSQSRASEYDSDLQPSRLQSTYLLLTLATLDENDTLVLKLLEVLNSSPANLSLSCYKKFLVKSGLHKQENYLVNLVSDASVWSVSGNVACRGLNMGSDWLRLSSQGELGVSLNVARFAPNLAKAAFTQSNPAYYYPIESLAYLGP